MLTGVVAFLLLLVALLAIPVTLTFKVSWRGVFQNDIELRWPLGLVRVRIPSRQRKAPYPAREETQQVIGRLGRSSRKKQNFFVIVQRKQFRRRIIRFVNDLWHAVHKKNVSLRIRIGLGDPADTGQLWGIFGPISGMLANVEEASVEIEPEFLDTTFELDSSGNVRIIPLQMIYLTVALLLSPPVWQGIRQIRAAGQ